MVALEIREEVWWSILSRAHRRGWTIFSVWKKSAKHHQLDGALARKVF